MGAFGKVGQGVGAIVGAREIKETWSWIREMAAVMDPRKVKREPTVFETFEGAVARVFAVAVEVDRVVAGVVQAGVGQHADTTFGGLDRQAGEIGIRIFAAPFNSRRSKPAGCTPRRFGPPTRGCGSPFKSA